MNERIYKEIKENKDNIFNVLSIISKFGFTHLDDIEKLYNNEKFQNATVLRTYNEWNKMGYYINGGQKGIRLYKNKEEQQVYFDISQLRPNTQVEQKSINIPTIDDPIILYNNIGGENTNIYKKYSEFLTNNIPNKYNTLEKSCIEDLVSYCVLNKFKTFDKIDDIFKTQMQKLVKNYVDDVLIDNNKFNEILQDVAILSFKTIYKTLEYAKEENRYKIIPLDKIKSLTNNINDTNNHNISQNERKEGVMYEELNQGNGKESKENELRNNSGKESNLGANDRGRQIEALGNGGQLQNNISNEEREWRGERISKLPIHTNNQQVLHRDIGSTSNKQTNDTISRGSVGNRGDARERYDQNGHRHMGTGTSLQYETTINSRQNKSRFDQMSLFEFIENQTREEEIKRHNEWVEQRRKENDVTIKDDTIKQMEIATHISNGLQNKDNRGIRPDDKTEDRGITIDTISEELKREGNQSERDIRRRERNINVGYNSQRTEESSINQNNNLINDNAGEKSPAFILLQKNNDFIYDDIENNKFNLKERFENNVNAIRTLKQIESENRLATKEEQDILSKYVGWGGLANYCFDKDRADEKNYNLIKELLTKEEYTAAKESVTSAYYTPNYVIKEIYNKISDFGFKGGKILEPSCGIGKFFGNMPKEIKDNSKITGIELDNISARIAKLLYPSVNIKNQGFEDEKVNPDTNYNLIIGNIPFGDVSLYDPIYNKSHLKIHDYFIHKSLDMLADGGICAIISSTGTLDKKDDKARTLFAEQANFLGSVRLPSNTFGDTETATDILFFQKNKNNSLKLNQDFIKSDLFYNINNDNKALKKRFYNSKTKETFKLDYSTINQYITQECYKDLFEGQQISGTNDVEIKLNNNYHSNYYINGEKLKEINVQYLKWVENGKKEDEKPRINVKGDCLICNNIYQIENKNIKEKNIFEITTRERKTINLNHIIDKEKYVDINILNQNINSYYKQNSENIIGELYTDTGQYGRKIIINKIDNQEQLKNELKDKLNNIKAEYFEPETEEQEEENTIMYFRPGDNDWENNKVFDKKKYSHFLIGNKVCFKEDNRAYCVNNLSSKNIDILRYLIKIKETTHNILQNEVNNDIKSADENRVILKNTYDEFFKKYKLRINSTEIKKLIEEDDDKGLLLSLENGEYVQKEEHIPKKSKLKLDNNVEYEKLQLSNGQEVNIYIDNKGKRHYIDDDNNEIIIKYITYFQEKENIYAPIFTERVIQNKPELKNIDNAKDALIASLQTKGIVDVDFIANKASINKEEAIKELKDQIYYNYIDDEWQSKDDFLSGNIKQKIRKHEKLVKEKEQNIKVLNEQLKESEEQNDEKNIKELLYKISENNTKLEKIKLNIDTLKSVIPEKINFENIDINLGATWLPLKYYEKFIKDVFDLKIDGHYGGMKLVYKNKLKPPEYYVLNKNSDFNSETEVKFGTKDRKAIELFESAINLKPVEIIEYLKNPDGTITTIKKVEETALANEKIEKIKEAFKYWKENNLSNDEKTEIETIYNDTFNGTVARKFDGSILTFPGMNSNIKLNEHQKNGVARMVFGGNTGLAHCVGSGKTYEIITGAMKFKQLGLANKSLIVVPKPIVEQWQKEFMTLYPNANIIAPTEKDFTKENRKKFLSKIATNNYDAIILSQEQFQKIPLSKSRQEKYIRDQLIEYEEYIIELKDNSNYNNKTANNQTIKNIATKIKKLQEKLDELKNEKYKDNIMDFEELGIDKLFVDEAHYYKNAFYATKLNRIAGIQSSDTKRTYDLQQKCKYMNEKTNYKGVYLATGTPITNSITELYTMMKYLQDDKLEENGLANLDDFVANFCKIKTKYELNSTGAEYHQKTRINTFNNAPELINLFKENWDIINREDLNLALPIANRINIQLEATEEQKHLMQTFVERCQKMQPPNKIDPHKDNMLKLTNDGKLSAIDPKLYDINLPEEEGTKPNACIKNIIKEYFETIDEKGTQLIVCDVGVPKPGKKYDIYNFIKNKLIEQGIKKEEIAFATDFETPEQKQQMQKQMNEGKIRILIGSTDKVGTGLNVQHKMKALHHLTLPWKPSDIEQREGRIIRQGNMYKNINIYTYVTKGTFDARSFEILESKANMINQIMHGNNKIRRYEKLDKDDNSCISYEELIELSLPNSNIKKIKELEREIKTLKTEENEFNIRKRENEYKLKNIPNDIEEAKSLKEKVAKDVEQVKTYTTDSDNKDNYKFIVYGKSINDKNVYTSRQEAAKGLFDRMFSEDKNIFHKTEYTKIAEYKDFVITINYDAINKNFRMRIKSNISNHLYNNVDLGDSEIGNITKIENFIKSLNEDRLDEQQKRIEYLEKEYQNLKKSVEYKFDKKEKLENKIKEYNVLLKENETQKEEIKQKNVLK